ncbi:MAG: acetyltransferase [Candidatus Dormibacteria bacterium]
MNVDSIRLAERVRAALVQSALDAYEDAALRGLCCRGAWEAAVSAMRRQNLNRVLTEPIVESGR